MIRIKQGTIHFIYDLSYRIFALYCYFWTHTSMTISERIVFLRKQNGFSQTDLAKHVDASREAISKYERGEATPSVDIAKKIALALGVSLDYLVGDSEKRTFDKTTIRRMEEIENLPEEEKQTLFKIIDMTIAYNKGKQAYAS